MCGIAGIWNTGGEPIDPAALELMVGLQSHRGPDGQGFALFPTHVTHSPHSGTSTPGSIYAGPTLPLGGSPNTSLGLGHRRLSIIDLSDAGFQPMSVENGRYWITYNGEIYNYLELRAELEGLGRRFTSNSDTEVLLRSYVQWGVECVQRFNGMWAFAIWDTVEQMLFCSRDRMGIKPFYYSFTAGRFVFASEIKAVLAAPPNPDSPQPLLNEPYIARFILYGLLNDSDQTCFKDVRQLLPAHNLLIKNSQLQLWRYWDIPDAAVTTSQDKPPDFNETAEQFRELLIDAIRLRFRADVPVGVSLSGGLDSSSVTALAARLFDKPIHTFTIAYTEPDLAEGHYAQEVAQTFRTDARTLTPAAADYPDFIADFSWHHDEPCVGAGMFSQWQVLKLTGRHVPVVLEGQGADELLGGYSHYLVYYLLSLLHARKNPQDNYATAGQYKQDLQSILTGTGRSHWSLQRQLLTHRLYERIPARWRQHYRGIKTSLLGKLIDPQWHRDVAPLPLQTQTKYPDALNNLLYCDLTQTNLPMLLQNGDRISMAFSVESRLPFLDYRLVEFTAALPYHFKIRGLQTKHLLRKSMSDILPESVINRRDKKGFPTPFGSWLRGPLKDYARDIFDSSTFKTRGLFNHRRLRETFNDHLLGRADHTWLIWRVLNLETWMQCFNDGFAGECRRRSHSHCHRDHRGR